MSGPSSMALFVLYGIRTSANHLIIALFWMGFSGLQEPVHLGETCPKSSESGRRSIVSSAAGLGGTVGGYLGCAEPRRDCLLQPSDGRQYRDTRPSSCGGCKRGAPKEALGRSRGGFSTKIHLRVNGAGLPMRTEITPSQDSDYTGYDLVNGRQPAAACGSGGGQRL